MHRQNLSTRILIFSAIFFFVFPSIGESQKLYNKLEEYCILLPSEFDKIKDERKENLDILGEYILSNSPGESGISLLFVCDMNSRRSQFAQVWAQTAASFYKINKLMAYSGGLSETAINYRIMESLKRAGFSVTAAEAYSQNPVYLLSIGRKYPDIFIFSKKYDYWNNPSTDFASVFCSKSETFSKLKILGSEQIIELPYEDVKIFDNSFGGAEKNDQVCREIAREMFYVMDFVKTKMKQNKVSHKKAADLVDLINYYNRL